MTAAGTRRDHCRHDRGRPPARPLPARRLLAGHGQASSFQRGSLSQSSVRRAAVSSAFAASSLVAYGPSRSALRQPSSASTVLWTRQKYHRCEVAIVHLRADNPRSSVAAFGTKRRLPIVTVLVPGTLSPTRPVPAHIPRPEYVGRTRPAPSLGSEIKDADTIERMRSAGRIAARAMAEVAAHIRPGITTDELDRIGHEYLIEHNAYPSTLGYKGFPKSLCTSINEVICHGIPDSTELRDGDIVNIDTTAHVDGVHGDTDATYLVGDVDDESRLLVERTEEAMLRGVRAVAPGRQISVIGRVIESYAKRFGYGVIRDFTGHGIGTAFHSGLVIPHFDDPRYSTQMEPGMTFTIEPMLTLGTIEYELWPDRWTAVTKDRKRTAQFEHTVLVTDTGHEILTLP